jgi:D-lactate dehydrogenase (cytochrome)
VVTEGSGNSLCSLFLTLLGLAATLRLAPLLPTKVAIAQFPNIQQAVSAVQEILSSPQGLHIRKFSDASTSTPFTRHHSECVELLDDRSECIAFLFFKYLELTRNLVMSAINVAGLVDKPYPVKDTLFFKIQGDASSIAQASKTVGTIVNKHGSLRFHFAATDKEADELWQNRKYALMSTLAAHPGTRCWTTDVWYGLFYNFPNQ